VIEESQAAEGELARGLRPETWPKREDTREFEAVELPPHAGDEPGEDAELSLAVEDDDGPGAGRDFVWG
jgi:hypothetical protein